MPDCLRLYARALVAVGMALVLGVGAVVPVHAVQGASAMGGATDGLPVVALADLPSQAKATYGLILQGGPFPYEKDGTVFRNRERLLPSAKRGYYREYTVKTPRVRHRGARRIVCGGEQPVQPDVCYYTADHYASFQVIAP